MMSEKIRMQIAGEIHKAEKSLKTLDRSPETAYEAAVLRGHIWGMREQLLAARAAERAPASARAVA